MVSHNHYVHLDADTVQQLATMPQCSPRFLVPKSVKAWFAALNVTRVGEYGWWEETTEDTLRITFVPAQHWSRRRQELGLTPSQFNVIKIGETQRREKVPP